MVELGTDNDATSPLYDVGDDKDIFGTRINDEDLAIRVASIVSELFANTGNSGIAGNTIHAADI